MSNSIPGRGKQRKNGQDLNAGVMPMGGGPMVMPPNGTFVTPTVHQHGHVPTTNDYPRAAPGYVLELQHQPHQGTQGASLILPPGSTLQPVPPSSYAQMQGNPNARPGADSVPNPNMQWQNQQQQNIMQSGMGGMPQYMQQQQQQRLPQQQRMQYPQQPQMGYANVPAGYYHPAQYAQQYPQEQMYAAGMYPVYNGQMIPQQQYMTQPQQAGAPMHAPQAQPALHQGGAPPAGIAPGMAGMQQSNMGMAPASGAPNSYPGPAPVQHSHPAAPMMNPAQQSRPNVPAPAEPRKRNILMIVDPNTKETVNKEAVEASQREDDAPKADKDDSKGTDEMDSAAPEVKKQFATQILEQTNKSDQPAPAPAAALPVKASKCLFDASQLKQLNLSDKSDKSLEKEKEAVAVEVKKETEKKEKERESEFIPDRLLEPAYPNNYKEKQQQKQTSPDVTVSEMPAANNDEQRDDSHLTAQDDEIPASSSSEKNTSNDSAICVQTPVTPPPQTATEQTTVVVAESETVAAVAPAAEEEETTVAAPAAEKKPEPVAAVPIEKKLAQLEIVESVSQDEGSEPSTPAPVTPSVSETNTTLAEEEEDAEKAAAAAEEELQRKKAELEEEATKLQADPDQCDEAKGRYNREFLYNVRDYEMLFQVTACPLELLQRKELGVCRSLASSEPKKRDGGQGGFMPGWARQGGAPRTDRKAYQGRASEQHHRAGPRGGGSNKKLPPQIRPSIERRVDTNVQLHKAANAWKGDKVAADDESDEATKKMLLKNVRALFNKITPTTKDALINEFLAFKVYDTPALPDIISVIFDKAVEEPKFCPLYSSLCSIQVNEELAKNKNVSQFRNAILQRAQEVFSTKTQDDYIEEKNKEIEAEEDEKKKKEKQIELLEAKSKFRRRKFGNITFIGQLYLQQLLSTRIIHFCVFDLLKSVLEKKADTEIDDESVDCAVRLVETIGKRLQDELRKTQDEAKTMKDRGVKPPPALQEALASRQGFFEKTFDIFNTAKQHVSVRIKFMITDLQELKQRNWVPRNTKDAGPKKLDEIKKDIQKEAMENQQAQQQYERKVSRGGMGGPMGGGGGGHGGHGGNQKRGVIQRNSIERGTPDERRSQAHKSSNLIPRNASLQKKASLSSVTTSERGSLGGSSKNKWSGGASGGSESSRKEERAAGIQAAARIGAGPRSSSQASMKEDDGANASGNATQVNSEDEREANEKREKQEEKIVTRVLCDVKDYVSGEISLEEVREEIFKSVGNEKFENPSIDTVFKCLMNAATMRRNQLDMVAKFGLVISFCLLKKAEEKNNKERDEILKGIADFCREVVDKEIWEDVPKIWDFVAEVLINAHMPKEDLFVGAHATLVDFKDAFLVAAKDDRKPYTLFVLVLKRLAEMHHTRDKDNYLDVASWALDECEAITKKIDVNKLDKALKETTMEFNDNLHAILRHHQ